MLHQRNRRSLLIPLLLVALVGATLLLRSWSLQSLPPGLWWDEASQGLDARDLLHGHFRVFFTRAEGKEPLYIYLTTPFVAAWNGQPLATRAAGAVLGALMVLALYVVARALWLGQPTVSLWVAAISAGLWAVNYWPQSINRIGFQVNAFPIAITLAVATWLNWRHRPTRHRALAFGLVAGLALATYLAARFTPLLWILLFLALPSARRRALRPTMGWALLGLSFIAVPLAVHFALHPQEFANRASVFPLLRGDFGRDVLQPLAASARDVAGVFLGLTGDPNYRHNIPGRPAFSPLLGISFALGVGAAAWSLRRRDDPRGWTLLAWLLVLSLPSVLSMASNPHYPRLFGALPAALLLTAWPLAELASWLAARGRLWRATAIVCLALLLGAEGARTVRDYFVAWPRLDLYAAFNGDTMLLGRRLEALTTTGNAVGVVPAYGDATHILDYAFPDAPIFEVQLDEETIASWLDNHLAGAAGKLVLTPVWTVEPEVYADAKQAVPFYLQREGVAQTEEHYRNFDLMGYTLGEHPAFGAAGNQVTLEQPFGEDVKLVEARWGPAYPNLDRNGASANAGTPFWVILTWQVDRPLTNLRAAVDLVDPQGHRLGHADQQLVRVAEDTPETPLHWAPKTLMHTYHLVDVPAAHLPGPATLEARLYDSETLAPLRPAAGTARGSLVVAEAATGPAGDLASENAVQPAQPLDVALPGGVTLLGSDGWPDTVQPGSLLTLQIYWRALQPLPADQRYEVALESTSVTSTLDLPAGLPAGRAVQTYADLRLPPDLAPGEYPLILKAAGSDTQRLAVLGAIRVHGRPRQFEAPAFRTALDATFGGQVALLGVDAAGPSPLEVAPGQALTLTLGWKAQATPGEDPVRFVHLLGPDGAPVAQQDSRLCRGDCPGSSWLPGEVFVDQVQLSVPADLRPGTYRLAVGWYDAATLQRLPAMNGAGQAVADNLLILPILVEVKP